MYFEYRIESFLPIFGKNFAFLKIICVGEALYKGIKLAQEKTLYTAIILFYKYFEKKPITCLSH